MLVIISDLHLTDGTSGETIKEGAFRVFRNRLYDLAYDASWRADGKYNPIETIDLILLGDILDPLRSTRWLAEEDSISSLARPWDDPQSQPFIDKVRAITEAILQNNAASLNILYSISWRASSSPTSSLSASPRALGGRGNNISDFMSKSLAAMTRKSARISAFISSRRPMYSRYWSVTWARETLVMSSSRFSINCSKRSRGPSKT